jgi:BirA family biotin operon repressor/biotin-[acetyl-CoA-carboxylase] ligase
MNLHWKIIELDTVGSTNNYASMQLSDNKIVENTVIVAWSQNKGRGMLNNLWESEAYKNLTFSVVIFPNWLKADCQFCVSKAISLAIVDYLKTLNITAQIKWPNDIYVNNSKIAGILIENSIMGNNIFSSIIGIGLNVNQEVFLSNAPNPISVKQILNKEVHLKEALHALLDNIESRLDQLQLKGIQCVDNEYLSNMYQYNQWHTYEANGKTFEGRITGTLKTGELIVETRNGEMKQFLFKEISFINE